MHCPNTIKQIDNQKALKSLLKVKPMPLIKKVDDVRRIPDYDGISTEMIEKETGMEHIETLFVDSSGFSSDNEPAMSQGAFMERIQALLDTRGSLKACLTGVGQFQVYVSIFKARAVK